MFSGNLKPRRTRQEEKRGKEKKRVKETFRGPECQRYHYLHISLDEAHLAGLVSHSQWDPEVKGASYQDKRAADSWVMKRKKTLCELALPFSTTKGQ
ncbi:50S ribosomal protein L2 [Dissostichus eleginoides]|uniref:50S ribosomal protein L2 n=1 Tax=Dissostichus eleginoides TaxID=100907 RepID=A0AAD9C135_DISEL|nr:50S ribosomal protein L2 [Dissostichus eleginoides]